MLTIHQNQQGNDCGNSLYINNVHNYAFTTLQTFLPIGSNSVKEDTAMLKCIPGSPHNCTSCSLCPQLREGKFVVYRLCDLNVFILTSSQFQFHQTCANISCRQFYLQSLLRICPLMTIMKHALCESLFIYFHSRECLQRPVLQSRLLTI